MCAPSVLSIAYAVVEPLGSPTKTLQINQVAFPGHANEMTTSSFYNGLGELIQQRTYYVEGGNTVASWTANSYDALGRPICQSVPQGDTVPGYEDTTCLDETDKTQTVYDELGRAVQVIAPNGDSTYKLYTVDENNGLFWTDLYDANQRNRREAYDVFGRLVEVEEMTGDCGNSLPDFYDALEVMAAQPGAIIRTPSTATIF
jgi:hypothetical protein